MTIVTILFASLIAIIFGVLHLHSCTIKSLPVAIIAIAAGVGGVFIALDMITKEEEEIRQKQKIALEQKKKDEEPLKVPQLLSEKDGCSVYKFMDEGKWHYFTKCGNSVSTEKSYTERVGKRTISKSEVITTN